MAPTNSKVSYDSIITVMDLLKDPKMTFSSVASFTGLSESTIVRIFDKHCHIPRIHSKTEAKNASASPHQLVECIHIIWWLFFLTPH